MKEITLYAMIYHSKVNKDIIEYLKQMIDKYDVKTK